MNSIDHDLRPMRRPLRAHDRRQNRPRIVDRSFIPLVCVAAAVGACLGPSMGCRDAPVTPPASQGEPPRSEVAAALKQLATLQARRQWTGSDAGYHDALRAIAPSLPSVSVQTADEPVRWTTMRINEQGEQFFAFRIRSPLDVPADLRWAIIAPVGTTLGTIDALRGELDSRGQNSWSERNQTIDGLRVPDENLVAMQSLDGGAIQPGQEYVLALFLADRAPRDLHLAVRLVPAGKLAVARSFSDVARDLEVDTSMRSTNVQEVAEQLAQVGVAYYDRDLPAAIAAAEVAIRLQPAHRRTLLTLASLLTSRGRQAAANGEDQDAAAYFFRAAQAMRTLRERYDDLDEQERRWLGEALYGEALSFAATDHLPRALAALTEALDDGFSDWQRIDAAPEFASLRDSPEWRALVAKRRDADAQDLRSPAIPP